MHITEGYFLLHNLGEKQLQTRRARWAQVR